MNNIKGINDLVSIYGIYKDSVNIVILIYSLNDESVKKSLISLLYDVDYSKYNIRIKVLIKNDLFIDNMNIEYLYESEQVYWHSVSKGINSLSIDDNTDIIIGYDSPIAITELINTKNKIGIKKVGWIIDKLDNIVKGYTRESLIKIYYEIDTLVCISQYDKDMILINTGYNDDNKICIYNGDKKYINLEKINNNKLVVVSMGRLIEEKGFFRLIKIHKRLIDEGIDHKLEILGDGILKNQYEQLINELGINDTCELLGYKKNPYEFINKCDLFVLASYGEGLPLAIMESMILGKPILATNVSGSNELLSNGNGMLVNNDDEGIYNGMKELIINQPLRDSYCNRLKTIEQFEFDEKVVIPKIENLFDNCRENYYENRKTSILFVMYTMLTGGAEKALVYTINKLDFLKYDVDLIVLGKEQVNLYDINENINVKYIYETYKEVDENFKDLKYDLNKKYDVEIAYLDISSIAFILNNGSESAKKIAWVHGNIKYLTIRNTMEYLEEMYYKMNKIVCVSNSTKENFINLLGEKFINKVDVIYNAMPVDKIRKI